MHVVGDPSLVVHHEDLLAAGVDDHAERRPERRHDRGELSFLVLELVERARAHVLGHHPVDRDELDAERVQQLRQELRGRPVRIVDDNLELSGRDLAPVHDLREERLAVGLADARRLEDAAHVLVRHAAEVLAEEHRLDLALLRLAHVERLPIEELHVAYANVERRDAHVDAAGRADAPGVEPADRQRRLPQVRHVNPRGDDAAHERALEHAARAVLVAVHRDGAALWQRRSVGRSEARGELRREVDVHQAGHAEAPEQRAASLRAPDEAGTHDRSALDLLVRPDLHLAPHARVVVDDAVVADDASLLEGHARLERALASDDRAVELGALADVAVAPHDRAVDDRADVDGDVVAQDGRADDLDLGSDLHAIPQIHGAGDARGLVDLDVAVGVHAGQDLLAERGRGQLALKQIRVRAHVLGDRSDIGPVAGGDVAIQRLALGQQRREEILAEIERLAGLVALEHAWLDHVDTGVDGVGEDLAPRGLLQELGDPAVLAADDHAVLEGIRDVHERQRHGGPPLLVEREHLREIDIGQRITRDDEERIAERIADLTHRSTRAQRRLLDAVAQPHPERPTVAEAVLDLRGEVLQGHEGVVDAVALHEIEDVPEAWLIDDRDYRLGPIDRQGPQAAPLAAGHDHGLHEVSLGGRRRACLLRPRTSPRGRGASTRGTPRGYASARRPGPARSGA